MFGCIYCFERISAESGTSASQAAAKILRTATYDVRGIRFHELTDRRNPKPLFAVLFAHNAAKNYFEEMLDCLLEPNGLRAGILHPVERAPAQEIPALLDNAAGAANATEFEQRHTAQSEHHAIPPSLKEWARAL